MAACRRRPHRSIVLHSIFSVERSHEEQTNDNQQHRHSVSLLVKPTKEPKIKIVISRAEHNKSGIGRQLESGFSS